MIQPRSYLNVVLALEDTYFEVSWMLSQAIYQVGVQCPLLSCTPRQLCMGYKSISWVLSICKLEVLPIGMF